MIPGPRSLRTPLLSSVRFLTNPIRQLHSFSFAGLSQGARSAYREGLKVSKTLKGLDAQLTAHDDGLLKQFRRYADERARVLAKRAAHPDGSENPLYTQKILSEHLFNSRKLAALQTGQLTSLVKSTRNYVDRLQPGKIHLVEINRQRLGYLAHEAQHAIDFRNFIAQTKTEKRGKLTIGRRVNLEYRAYRKQHQVDLELGYPSSVPFGDPKQAAAIYRKKNPARWRGSSL